MYVTSSTTLLELSLAIPVNNLANVQLESKRKPFSSSLNEAKYLRQEGMSVETE
jgi:hypothetical protein